MAGCLYYLPKAAAASRDQIREAGLGYILEDGLPISTCRVSTGPDNTGGLVVAQWLPDATQQRIGYFKDLQVWRVVPCDNPIKPFAGVYRDHRSGPSDLQRKQMLPGQSVTLGDGNAWVVPVVLSWQGNEDDAGYQLELPSRVDVDDAGNWITGSVISQYENLYQRIKAFYEAWYAEFSLTSKLSEEHVGEMVKLTFSYGDLYDTALSLLQTNYRIGKAEISLLGLLDGRNVPDVCKVAIDYAVVMDYWKKKLFRDLRASDSSPTGDGSAVSAQGTAQPLAN